MLGEAKRVCDTLVRIIHISGKVNSNLPVPASKFIPPRNKSPATCISCSANDISIPTCFTTSHCRSFLDRSTFHRYSSCSTSYDQYTRCTVFCYPIKSASLSSVSGLRFCATCAVPNCAILPIPYHIPLLPTPTVYRCTNREYVYFGRCDCYDNCNNIQWEILVRRRIGEAEEIG